MTVTGHITERRQRTREKLIRAAISVFAHSGVAGASIEQLSEAAGMTRGAFYSNFESKDELVLAVIDFAIERMTSELRTHIEVRHGEDSPCAESESLATADPQTRRREIAATALRVFEERRPIPVGSASAEWIVCEKEIELYTVRVPELRSKYQQLMDAQLRTIAEIVETTLRRHGCHPTIPSLDLLRILAAVARQSQMDAITGGIGQADVQADAKSTVQVLLGFIDID